MSWSQNVVARVALPGLGQHDITLTHYGKGDYSGQLKIDAGMIALYFNANRYDKDGRPLPATQRNNPGVSK